MRQFHTRKLCHYFQDPSRPSASPPTLAEEIKNYAEDSVLVEDVEDMKTKQSASKIVKNFDNKKGQPLPEMHVLMNIADELGELYQASVQTTASTKVST